MMDLIENEKPFDAAFFLDPESKWVEQNISASLFPFKLIKLPIDEIWKKL